jgi:hypothetical protein
VQNRAGRSRWKTTCQPKLRGFFRVAGRTSTRLALSDYREGFAPPDCASTRFWSKSRSCRKQTIKPLLPGATTTCSDLAFLALFSNNVAKSDRERRRPNGTKLFHSPAAKSSVRVRHLYVGRMLLLPGETATNGVHRTHPE